MDCAVDKETSPTERSLDELARPMDRTVDELARPMDRTVDELARPMKRCLDELVRPIGPLRPCRFRMVLRQISRRSENPFARMNRRIEQSILMNCKSLSRKEAVQGPKPPSFAVSLPLEILIEILARLPSRSLMRFKCVCKSWHDLIEDPQFAGLHFRTRSRAPDLHVLTFTFMRNKKGCFMHYFEQDCHEIDAVNLAPHNGKGFCKISNSCNGLVCVSGSSTTYVVNPSIRQKVQLQEPPPSLYFRVALGHDISTGAYKVVWLFTPDKFTAGCMVYTMGLSSGSLPWRSVRPPPFWVGHHAPVFVDGFLVWTIEAHDESVGPEIAISFDVKNETFDTISHPGGGSRCEHSYIVELEGCLCFVDTPDPRFSYEKKELWILEDCRTRNWIKRKIDLGRIENPTHGWIRHLVLLAIRDGRILINDRLGKFDFYDPVTGCNDRTLHLTSGLAIPYVESLISPLRIRDGSMRWKLPEEEAVHKCKPWQCWQRRRHQQEDGTLSSGCSCTKSHGSWWEWSGLSSSIDPSLKFLQHQEIREMLWPYSIPDGFSLYSCKV